jgi:hypothetical protein
VSSPEAFPSLHLMTEMGLISEALFFVLLFKIQADPDKG